MKRLQNALFGPSERSFGIYGLGGVGKTQLALRAVTTLSARYSHMFWVPAETELKLSAAFRQIAIGLGEIDESETDSGRSQQAVKDWLGRNADWLLVFDNADDAKTLTRYFPSQPRGSIITTSRSPALVERSIVADGLRLETLTNDQGSEFLLSRLRLGRMPSAEDRILTSEISKELGGHTLGLATMAAYITDLRCKLEDFLKYFRRNRSRLIDTTKRLEDVSFDYDLSFATCRSISIDSISDKDPGDLLGILAILDPDSISEDILKNYAEDDQSALITVLRDPETYLDALITLRTKRLVDKTMQETDATASQLITIHRMVQEAAIRTLLEYGGLAQAFDNAVECLSRIYPHQIHGESMFEHFPACRRLTPHIISLEGILRQHFPPRSMPPGSEIPTGRETFVTLLADAGWYLNEIGLSEDAESLLLAGESICHNLFGDTPNRLTALIYNNLGSLLDSVNRPDDAMAYAMKCLDIREKCLPPDDPDMGNAYYNLGNNFLEASEFKKAQEYYTRAAVIHEKSPTPSHDRLEGVYSCLGVSLLHQGQLDEADDWLKRAISHHESLGPNRFVALTISTLGTLRMKQDRWTEAKDIFLQCTELWKRVSGPENRLVRTSLHLLVFVQAYLGGTHEAIHSLRQAVVIFRNPQVFGIWSSREVHVEASGLLRQDR